MSSFKKRFEDHDFQILLLFFCNNKLTCRPLDFHVRWLPPLFRFHFSISTAILFYHSRVSLRGSSSSETISNRCLYCGLNGARCEQWDDLAGGSALGCLHASCVMPLLQRHCQKQEGSQPLLDFPAIIHACAILKRPGPRPIFQQLNTSAQTCWLQHRTQPQASKHQDLTTPVLNAGLKPLGSKSLSLKHTRRVPRMLTQVDRTAFPLFLLRPPLPLSHNGAKSPLFQAPRPK